MRPHERALVLALLVALSAASSGCAWRWGAAKSQDVAAMSEPEAGSLLIRARKHLYEDTDKDRDTAVRLADSIILNCDTERYVWEAFVVKASAYVQGGWYNDALATAKQGVHAILTLDPGPLSGDSWTALRMLVPRYVDAFALADAHEEGMATLASWRKELLARHAGEGRWEQDRREAVENAFALLTDMAEQYAASEARGSSAKATVLEYVRVYNRAAPGDLPALFVSEDEWSPSVRRLLSVDPVQAGRPARLYLSGDVEVKLSLDSRHASALGAEATCDMICTSASGWARRFPGVRFVLVRGARGRWVIADIIGHP